MIQISEEKLKEILYEVTHQSHTAIDKFTSDAFGEIKSDIRSLKETMEYIKKDNAERNGSFKRAVDSFVKKFADTDEAIDDLKTWKNVSAGGIAVLVVVVLPVLGFLVYEVVKLLIEVKINI